MGLAFMPFCWRKDFPCVFFGIFARHVFINFGLYGVHPTNTHTHSHTLDRMSHMWKWHFTSPENVGWWTSVGVWIRPSSQSDRTKCTWNIGSIVAKRRWNFLKFPHHAISIHQRLSWYKTKRATCHKMLVCHKIHWIIVARHRCQKKSAHTYTQSDLLRGFIYSVHKFISMCKWAQHFATVIASMMRFFFCVCQFFSSQSFFFHFFRWFVSQKPL